MLNEGAEERPLVVFRLDDQRYALDLERVRRALRVVAITPLPKAPKIILGIVNLVGEILPVVDLRACFNRPLRPLRLSDQLLIAMGRRRWVALLVDETLGLVDGSQQSVTNTTEILDGLRLIEGAVRLEDGLILIHDLDRLLSIDEERAIDSALESVAPNVADAAGSRAVPGQQAD